MNREKLSESKLSNLLDNVLEYARCYEDQEFAISVDNMNQADLVVRKIFDLGFAVVHMTCFRSAFPCVNITFRKGKLISVGKKL